MIAKFEIPQKERRFWGNGFDKIPEAALFPGNDRIYDLCVGIRSELKDELQPGDVGIFIKEWANLEDSIVKTSRRMAERNVSISQAISELSRRNILSESECLNRIT